MRAARACRLPQRRHGRVPGRRVGRRRRRALLLPRDEHAAAGRAPGHRSGRPASISCARSCSSRRASRCRGRSRSLTQRGHAIEAASTPRIRRTDFLPQAGPLLLYREPRMPGIRVDSGVDEGDEVPVHYDPLLAKVIAHGETRDAGHRAAVVPRCATFPILGIRTNIPFLLRVLEHPRFRAGDDRHRLSRRRRRGARRAEPGATSRPSSQAADRPRQRDPARIRSQAPAAARPRIRGRACRRNVARDRRGIGAGDRTASTRRWPDERARLRGRIAGDDAGRSGTASVFRTAERRTPSAARTAPRTRRGSVADRADAGDGRQGARGAGRTRSTSGDTLVILEAMKMELPVRAPGDGVGRRRCTAARASWCSRSRR